MQQRNAFDTSSINEPHGGQPVLHAGAALEDARLALILLHGRGAGAADILTLGAALQRDDLCYLAPQAAGATWYPYSFMAPFEQNQPGIDSAHAVIESIIESLQDAGFESDRIGLLGFSQGACLATDHVARFPRRYAMVAAYTGGLIGPPEYLFTYDGDLLQTPIFLGANDPDPHVPWSRIEQTAQHLRDMNADVQLKRYPNLPHSVNEDQISITRTMLERIATS